MLIVAIALASGRLPSSTITPNNKPTVAATIFPLYDITRNVAGDSLNVELVLPIGASPHTFEPTPSLLRNLQDTSVVYAIGYGADDWSFTIAESVGADVKLVDDGIVIQGYDANEGEVDHDHGELDPHYWLTFENATLIVQTVRDDLSARFPEYAESFEINAQVYLLALQEADQEAWRIITDSIETNNIITLHDAWYYFSDSFGINIVGTFEPSAGTEPTPQYLIDLTEALNVAGTDVLYAEPQLSTQSLQAFLTDNNLSIATLDPLGGTDQTPSFIDLMLFNVQTIADNQ